MKYIRNRFTEMGVFSRGADADAAGSSTLLERLDQALQSTRIAPNVLLFSNRERKFCAILEACDFLTAREYAAAIFFHFPAELRGFLAYAVGRANEFYDFSDIDGTAPAGGRTTIADAAVVLRQSDRAVRPAGSLSHAVAVLGDCHPLSRKDDAVIEALLRMSNIRAVLQFVASDEAPLHFARRMSDMLWSASTSKQMHFAESQVLTRALNRARRAYEKAVISDVATSSAEEWIRLNCPNVFQG